MDHVVQQFSVVTKLGQSTQLGNKCGDRLPIAAVKTRALYCLGRRRVVMIHQNGHQLIVQFSPGLVGDTRFLNRAYVDELKTDNNTALFFPASVISLKMINAFNVLCSVLLGTVKLIFFPSTIAILIANLCGVFWRTECSYLWLTVRPNLTLLISCAYMTWLHNRTHTTPQQYPTKCAFSKAMIWCQFVHVRMHIVVTRH